MAEWYMNKLVTSDWRIELLLHPLGKGGNSRGILSLCQLFSASALCLITDLEPVWAVWRTVILYHPV